MCTVLSWMHVAQCIHSRHNSPCQMSETSQGLYSSGRSVKLSPNISWQKIWWCATCRTSTWEGWSEVGGSQQAYSLPSLLQQFMSKKPEGKLKKTQTATGEVCTHACQCACVYGTQTGSENRAITLCKSQHLYRHPNHWQERFFSFKQIGSGSTQ